MKLNRIFLIALAQFIPATGPLIAGDLSPHRMSAFQDYLGQVRSIEPGEMLADVRAMDAEPQRYLFKIADDAGLRRYVRLRAMTVLGYFEDEATARYLEGKILNERANPVLRNQAVRSYAGAYYKKNPGRAERFLVESARRVASPRVRNEIAVVLREAGT